MTTREGVLACPLLGGKPCVGANCAWFVTVQHGHQKQMTGCAVPLLVGAANSGLSGMTGFSVQTNHPPDSPLA